MRPRNARHHRHRIRPQLQLQYSAAAPQARQPADMPSLLAPLPDAQGGELAQSSQRLWLAMCLPRFALVMDNSQPLAVIEGEGARSRVFTANTPALQAGVTPGLGLNAALALCANLGTVARSEQREQKALGQVAAWACQFTSIVSVSAPSTLLLEVGGSLRLFGGYVALRQQITAGLQAMGYTQEVVLALAPTPFAALWLGRAGDTRPVTSLGSLNARLAALPLAVLGWPEKLCDSLRGMGVRTVGECLRLPRDGFARRFGAERLRALDQALGKHPDLRVHFQLPPTFEATVPLPVASDSLHLIDLAIERLLVQLSGYLRARDACVQQLQLVLQLLPEPDSELPTTPSSRIDFEINLVSPDRDAAHLHALTIAQVERQTLPAPVLAVTLHATQILTLKPEPTGLFDEPAQDPSRWRRLVEQLRSRLGQHNVFGLSLQAEHRPEQAWVTAEPASAPVPGDGLVARPRPLWLLAEPVALAAVRGFPHWHGKLSMVQGPERIETGWWDGQDVRRDYYIANSRCGSRVWIYRERHSESASKRWFLQGFFA